MAKTHEDEALEKAQAAELAQAGVKSTTVDGTTVVMDSGIDVGKTVDRAARRVAQRTGRRPFAMTIDMRNS